MTTSNLFLTKHFTFEMAHALLGYEGLCKNIHGHSYQLEVTVAGETVAGAPEGMMMDFHALKEVVQTAVVDIFDHSLVLSDQADAELIEVLQKNFERVRIMPYQPTTENLLADFAQRISPLLPHGVKLYSLRLHETESSCGELKFS
ncbi:MAG: 6-carboxytetrahydropterin synthase [Bacteroidales bacterium]|nr:6-carboxytetrahydropterin synthase [Bacteroidales bacterium]MDD6582737.1 6-carboxytetrahydropterin synthase [Bacteroidales bacterium]